MTHPRDDGMPVPKMPWKPSRAMRAWPAVTILVCLILTSPLLWLWYDARSAGNATRQHIITWVVVLGVPVVFWTLLACCTPVRRWIERVSLRAHLLPPDVAGRRIAAVLPVCAFVGSYLWWLMLFSGTAWSIVAAFVIFAVPAIPKMVDPDYHADMRPR